MEYAAHAGGHEQRLRTTLTLVMQHRPREVADLIAAGASNVEIGTGWGSPKVPWSRAWGVRSRAGIVAQVTRLRSE